MSTWRCGRRTFAKAATVRAGPQRVSPLYGAGVFPLIKCKVASHFPFSPSPALLTRCPRKGPGGYLLSALAFSYLIEPRGSCLQGQVQPHLAGRLPSGPRAQAEPGLGCAEAAGKRKEPV